MMTMKGWWRVGAVVSGLGVSAQPAVAQQYDSPETEQTVAALIDAHGGIDAWWAAGAVAFDHVMFTPYVMQEGDTQWWASHEVVERGEARAYQEWPVDGARLGKDAEGVWSVDWKRPNSPAGMATIHYRLTFMTWLTQEPDAVVTSVEPVTLPGDEAESLALDLAFGDRPPQFTLYVDPESNRLRGFRNGRSMHAIHRFGDMDGLSIPIDWTTYVGDRVIGHHTILNAKLLDAFDERLVEEPEGAVRGS